MPGNSFGQIFKITTFGESHGPGLGVVIDGCPSRIKLCTADFESAMARRRPGRQIYDSPRQEADRVEILSGVFEDQTTGAPITLYIHNQDADSKPTIFCANYSGPDMRIMPILKNTVTLIFEGVDAPQPGKQPPGSQPGWWRKRCFFHLGLKSKPIV